MLNKNIAIILAAGSGQRSNLELPKQLVNLAGLPIITHTLKAFSEIDEIDEIIIVCSKETIQPIKKIVKSKFLSKVKSIILGGKERYDSSLIAIKETEKYLRNHHVNLIFHDAVRPLISKKIILDVISKLHFYKAVNVADLTTDTIIEVDNNIITKIPNRSTLRNGQTPQGFHYHVIKKAYEIALKDPKFETTDDCGVVKKYLPNEPIYVVAGDPYNIKLTYEHDLHLLDKLLQIKKHKIKPNNDLSFLKDKIIVIFGATSGIGESTALLAKKSGAIVYKIGSKDVDIKNLDNIKKYLKSINSKIDYIINSTGLLIKKNLNLMNYDDILNLINTNYLGVINITLAAYPHLKKSQGSLLHFTSSSYTYGRAMYSIYSSTKAAVVNFTQAIADEWQDSEIKINCINPQRTNTPMRRRAFGKEPSETLLSSYEVAKYTLETLKSEGSGQVYSIRKHLKLN